MVALQFGEQCDIVKCGGFFCFFLGHDSGDGGFQEDIKCTAWMEGCVVNGSLEGLLLGKFPVLEYRYCIFPSIWCGGIRIGACQYSTPSPGMSETVDCIQKGVTHTSLWGVLECLCYAEYYCEVSRSLNPFLIPYCYI